jgi:hypothetical protein
VTPRLQRWLGITGLVFVVIVVVSVFMVSSTPNSNASLANLTTFYDSGHKVILPSVGRGRKTKRHFRFLGAPYRRDGKDNASSRTMSFVAP